MRDFRIDFGRGGKRVIKVRNIRLRAMTSEETWAQQERRAEESRQLAEIQRRIESTLIAPSKIPDRSNMISASVGFSDGKNMTKIAVVGKELNLATQIREYAETVKAPVALPPPTLVGEGDSPKNHTVVRILNSYGICDVQFLAYVLKSPDFRLSLESTSANGHKPEFWRILLRAQVAGLQGESCEHVSVSPQAGILANSATC